MDSTSLVSSIISPPSRPEPSKKRRRVITNAEKIDVRSYYLDSIVDAFVEGDRDRETDEETQPMSSVKQQEAMQAVQLLQRYEEQQEGGDNEILRRQGQLELTVQRRILNSQKQTQITSYFR
jgi:hypothetical protein